MRPARRRPGASEIYSRAAFSLYVHENVIWNDAEVIENNSGVFAGFSFLWPLRRLVRRPPALVIASHR
jgi:hypothetical protein